MCKIFECKQLESQLLVKQVLLSVKWTPHPNLFLHLLTPTVTPTYSYLHPSNSLSSFPQHLPLYPFCLPPSLEERDTICLPLAPVSLSSWPEWRTKQPKPENLAKAWTLKNNPLFFRDLIRPIFFLSPGPFVHLWGLVFCESLPCITVSFASVFKSNSSPELYIYLSQLH